MLCQAIPDSRLRSIATYQRRRVIGEKPVYTPRKLRSETVGFYLYAIRALPIAKPYALEIVRYRSSTGYIVPTSSTSRQLYLRIDADRMISATFSKKSHPTRATMVTYRYCLWIFHGTALRQDDKKPQIALSWHCLWLL